jgi:hypothetical protein
VQNNVLETTPTKVIMAKQKVMIDKFMLKKRFETYSYKCTVHGSSKMVVILNKTGRQKMSQCSKFFSLFCHIVCCVFQIDKTSEKV